MSNKDINRKTAEQISALTDNEWESESQLSGLLSQVNNDAQLREKFERYHLIRDVMQKDHSAILSSDFSSRMQAAIAEEPSIVALPKHDVADNKSNVTNISTRQDARPETRPENPPGNTRSGAASLSGEASHGGEYDLGEHDTISPIDAKSDLGSRRSSSGPIPSASSPWKKRIGGFAIAASVALVSLVGLNTLQQSDQPESLGIASLSGTTPAESDNIVVANVGVKPVQAVLPINATQPVVQLPAGINPVPQIEYVSNTSTYWVIPNQQRNSVTEQRLNMFLSKHIEHSPTANLGGMLPYSRLAGYDAAPVAPESVKADQ